MKSSQSALITQYGLVVQKWLIEDDKRKVDTVDGIGPFKLVRNKSTYAAFKQPRTLPMDVKHKTGEEQKMGEKEQGIVIFSGGYNHNTLLVDWLKQDSLNGKVNTPGVKPFRHVDLEIQ